MPKYKDEPPAVRVYTVCDESKYLIVRNVPSLGCGDELLKLFSTYGQVEECKPMDAEECEPYTDVYWIKFHLVSNARFAKRKLDESVFLGNRLQVSYAPAYESLSDTKEKLEGRRKEILARLNPRRSKGPSESVSEPLVSTPLLKHAFTPTPIVAQSQMSKSQAAPGGHKSSMLSASSDKELVPCVLLSFDDEQILMWRGKDWKSMYDDEMPKINLSSGDGSRVTNISEINSVPFRKSDTKSVCSSPKMMSLWQRAIESGKASVLDEIDLSPDELLSKIEEFESTSQAMEHSYPAIIYSNREGPVTLNAKHKNSLEANGYSEDDSDDVDYNDTLNNDSFEVVESLVPLGSLPVDLIAKELSNTEQ
ncbi:UNVERIFIED_CONTAM: CRS2-associated factor 2, chloroplastic [Sesamum indicum]